MTTFDLVVLGGGSGGYAAALRGAQLGLSVALVEADKVGGTCLHRGCIPTKALLHAAEVADAARDGEAFGVHSTFNGMDAPALNHYTRSVVDRLYGGLSGLVAQRGVHLVTATGRLVRDAEGLGVETASEGVLRGRYVVLATGSQPKTLGLPIDGDRVLTSDHALWLSELPASAVVLGGGVIGVELASAWRSFGVEVSIVEALPRLVPNEEPAISSVLERAFAKRGINVVTSAPMRSLDVRGDGVRVELETNLAIEADVVLVAVGRGPNSADKGFEEAGVRLDRGHVVVDDGLMTTTPGIYAVGDLVAGAQLAHRGFAHGLFVAERIANSLGRTSSRPALVADADIPRVTYCDPEIVSVGLTAEQAARGGAIEIAEYNLGGNGRAQILRTPGLVKIVRRTNGPIVGVHIIGSRVSELAAEAQLATSWETFPEDLASLLHAHPTLGEAISEAAMALAGRPLHSH
ncbi:MAG TPA: dihydrolipoyl dehydrogenase [Propionibacteriaceae bacterium]|nr:dihydrolipoyl dehydrogenase [Propionibacteriaceae bacterium]